MYRKAVQTRKLWAFACQLAADTYRLHLIYATTRPVLEDEAVFSSLESIESRMQEIAPVAQWSETLFDRMMTQRSRWNFTTH